MRISAFLGAGSSLELDGPSSSALTTAARKIKQVNLKSKYDESGSFFINEIANKLDDYFGPERCNFEDIYHTLEMLYSYSRISNVRIKKQFKPVLGAFFDELEENWFDRDLLIYAQRKLLETIGEEINRRENCFRPQEKHKWYADFWSKAVKTGTWDIYTLNYDNYIRKSICPSKVEDGFNLQKKLYSGFSPKSLYTEKTKLMHLHGNILYGYPRNEDTSDVLKFNFEDLVKYNKYECAKRSWFDRSSNNSQSHEQTRIGPIITGLRKTDKLQAYPYSFYHYHLQKSLLENPSLLIVGYSFGDFHFNHLLERMNELHGDNRRVVLITYIAEDDWYPRIEGRANPNYNEFKFICKSFGELDPFSGQEYGRAVVSKDECVRVYLKGFKDAVAHHAHEILDFLNAP